MISEKEMFAGKRWLLIGEAPNGAWKARRRFLDVMGSQSGMISQTDWRVAKKYIFVAGA